MERINQFALYEIGQNLERLRHHKGDVAPSDVFIELWEASNFLAKLRKGDPMPLGVSASRALELEQEVDSVLGATFYIKGEDGKNKFRFPDDEADKIAEWKWKSIVNKLDKFETVFAEEMRENATYYVPRRGIFFTKALVDSADETFPAETLDQLPEKARVEWRAAGRCIAFNLLSASGFHVARGVEAVLEVYYQTFCNKGTDETLRGWQDYIDALTQARTKGVDPLPSEKTLAELKQMKDDYRNPVVHPRIVLSEPDSRMLYNNGESLIIAMAQDLAEARKANAQPMLALVSP